MFLLFPRIRLRLSLLALPTLIVMLWTEGIAPFSVILASALWHECGHLLALKLLSYRVRRIDILPMGALIEVPEGIPYRDETVIAVSGPIASLSASAVCAALFFATKNVYALFGAAVNLVLGAFNLLPASKLDGGKALYCLLAHKRKATEPVCSAASYAAKLIFVLFALLCFFVSDRNFGVALLAAALLLQL